jgi:3-methyladenine DNA glycosylase Tag
LSQMHRQSLTAYGQPLCETVVDCPSPLSGAAVQNGGPIPAKTPLSEDISKALKKRGFKFVGPVIVYAWMQAVGLVNDHAKDCFRWKTVRALEKRT